MSSGFSAGGDFYNATGLSARSLNSAAMNTAATNTVNNNNINNNYFSQLPYRSQLPGLFLDPSSQIAHRTPSLIGKRTLMEFQTNQQQQQQNQNQNHGLNGLFLRSVKQRMYNHTSPISPLSPFDFSGNLSPEVSGLSSSSALLQQRFGVPLLQQLRPQQITVGNGNLNNNATSFSGIPYVNIPVQKNQESENKMKNRLQELEKQLLDDNEEEGDAGSVITNSEWNETIQNLISPNQKVQNPISTSPTSPSSSSSSSIASPASSCSKQSLMEIASAISEGKSDVASEILTRLSQISNPAGNSEQRLIEYMVSALKSRMNPAENPPPVEALYSKEHVVSTQLLYDLSPCFKLGFMAANLAILEATLEQQEINKKLHVLDFDIGQGGQYMNLLHALSSRPNGKPALVRISAVADHGSSGEDKVKAVGDLLSQLAGKLGVCLEFKVITQKLNELTRESLGCEHDEPLAVNFAFKLYRMPDESVSTENPRDELLRRVKALSPLVVTLVEQEMNANTAPFVARAGEVFAYYGTLFDSIESTVPRDNADRIRVEVGLSRKLANSVACEGRDRVERSEVFGKWRARMGMAGFALKPLSQDVAESMRARLSSGNRVNPGFTVKEDNGGVCFGWMGKTLTVASAWR